MQIIDAHHHLWAPETDPANTGYVWLKNIGAMKPFGDPTPIQRDYLVNEFRSESVEHELIGSVHVQTGLFLIRCGNRNGWNHYRLNTACLRCMLAFLI
jgi:predicted TIM-barrel fold metal-dependent hydrolase